MRMRQWLPSIGLLLLALVLGLVAGGGSGGGDNPTPSVKNPGPLGLEVLFTWLQETGADARALDEPLTQLPADLKTLVLAAPKARRLDADEFAAVKTFVERGGTLIWLAPIDALGLQSRLAEWLQPSRGEPLGGLAVEDRRDLGGRKIEVVRHLGLARGVLALRLSNSFGLNFENEETVAIVSGGALWARPVGQGEVWIAAGPELAEARRLSYEGNLQFWANAAARGPIAFDEFHHVPEEGPPLTANIPATFLQLGVMGLAFAFVFGRRLGPPRPEPKELHRSSLEYVAALAALTQKAGVEPALLRELHGRLRRLFHERLGLALTRVDAEIAREVAQALNRPHEQVTSLLAELANPGAATPGDFARLAQKAAELERDVVALSRG
jgi:hypothetical protein